MKIAVIGSHSATRLAAPFGDRAWQIWACSPANMGGVLPRHDAWFEVHVPAQAETRPDDYMEWLRGLPVLYMRDRLGHPNAMAYPDAEMKERFGPFFFTSSIAYVLAYAIAQKPEAIGLWGVHMASREEYEYQRAGCQYFIQRARECGIAIAVPPASRLLEPPAYQW